MDRIFSFWGKQGLSAVGPKGQVQALGNKNIQERAPEKVGYHTDTSSPGSSPSSSTLPRWVTTPGCLTCASVLSSEKMHVVMPASQHPSRL